MSGVGRHKGEEEGALKDLFKFWQVFWGDSPVRFNGSIVNTRKEFGRFSAFWQVLSCFWGDGLYFILLFIKWGRTVAWAETTTD